MMDQLGRFTQLTSVFQTVIRAQRQAGTSLEHVAPAAASVLALRRIRAILPSVIRLAAPAKLNLYLECLAHRADGYHELETIFQTIELHDTVAVSLEPGHGIALTCTDSRLPTGADNLAWRAADAVARLRPLALRVHILLDKRIPTGAGLGGGSSDAAAVLRALQRLLPDPLSAAELAEVALHLGSDVPFFLFGGTAHALGRGEQLTALPDLPRLAVTIIKPPRECSTPAVYRALTDAERGPRTPFGAEFWRTTLIHDPTPPLQNRLASAATRVEPQVGQVLAWLRETGVSHQVSGSGSACFAFGHVEVPAQWRSWHTWTRAAARLDALDLPAA